MLDHSEKLDMNRQKHILTPTILFSIALLLLYSPPGVSGESNTTADIQNVAPQVGTLTCCFESDCSGTYTPSAKTNYTLRCMATVTDNNSYQDISSGNFSFYMTSSGLSGSADLDIRYLNSTACNLYGGSGTTETVNCTISKVAYYADSGSWTANITVVDLAGNVGYNTKALTVNELIALEQTSTVSFGSMSIGATGSQTYPGKVNQSATTTNTGNVNINISITSPASMACSQTGSIPIYNITGNTTAGGTYPSACHLVASTTVGKADCPIFGIDIPDQEDTAVNAYGVTYWGVSVPSGIRGTCWADITFNGLKA
ncbi:Uncharacterised protein [uncultured archaeon]|nr:Uncharacterised protein [uncultured archaeon]